MKGKWWVVSILVIVFSGYVLAYGGEHETSTTSSLNGHADSEHNMAGHDMEGMDMEESGHSHAPVQEQPANRKVLGTFAAINLSFLAIGVWNKRFRRKGGSDVRETAL